MSVKDCYGKVLDFVKASGAKISKETVKEYADILEKLNVESMTRAEMGAKVQSLINETLAVSLAKKKAAEYITLQAREVAVSGIFAQGDKNWFESFRDFLEGGALKGGQGSNYDITTVRSTVLGQLTRAWRSATDFESHREILSSDVKTSNVSKSVYQELDAIQRGDLSNPSKSKEAQGVAKGINAILNQVFNLKKSFNPYMEKLNDYLVKQIHNSEKIQAVGEEQWVKDAMATYGKKSFLELSDLDKQKAFKDIYARIVSGEYGSVVHESFWSKAGSGPNVHRQMARQRSLIATDWEAQFEYAKKYGHDTIEQTIAHTLQAAARDIAVLDKFGPDPSAMYEGLKTRVKNKVGKQEFEIKEAKLDVRFKTATQNNLNVAKENLSKFTEGALTIQYLSKLGFHVFRSFPDLFLSAGLARGVNGNTVIGNAAQIVGQIIKTIPKNKLKSVLEDLDISSQTVLASTLSDMGVPHKQPGALGKMATAMGKISGMDKWVNSMRAGTGSLIATTMARHAEKSYSALDDFFKNNLARYNIGELEWDAIRLGVVDWKDQGMPGGKYKFLSAQGVEQLPKDVIENYLRKKGEFSGKDIPEDVLDLTRFKLGTRLGVLINDHVNLGSTTSGTRQKAFLLQGTDINSPTGIMLRLFTQFKSASMTSADVYRRVYASGKGDGGDLSAVTQMAVGSIFMWTLGQYARDAIEGKTPEDPMSASFIATAMVGSGAAGMLGDALISEGNTYGPPGTGILAALAGPVLGEGVKAIGLGVDYGKAFNDDKELPNREAFNLLKNNIPFQNLFLTKGVLDYYFLNSVNEFLGPGFIDRLNDKLEDRGQKKFLFNPDSSNFLGSE